MNCAYIPISRTLTVQNRHRLVVLRQSLNRHADLKALVEALVVAVARFQFRDQPQLLRVRRHQWTAHDKRARRHDVHIVGSRRVRQQRSRADLGGQRDRRSGHTDERGQHEATDEAHKHHDELALVHRVQSHVHGAFASVVMVGGRYVFVELAEQVAELGQCVAEAQQ